MEFNVCEFAANLTPLDLSIRMPAAEYESRVERVRAELAARGLDAAFAFGTEYRPGDTGWLTGYDPHIESTIVIVGPKKVLVLGSPDALRYAQEMIRVGEFKSLAASGIPDADYGGYEYVTLREAFIETCGQAAKSDYNFPAGIAIQIDVGIVGLPFKSLPANRVGLRLEDPFLIDTQGRSERLTTLPLGINRPL